MEGAKIVLADVALSVWSVRRKYRANFFEVLRIDRLAVEIALAKLNAHTSDLSSSALTPSSTAYISRKYGLSFTTRPSTSTQACALKGICCAPSIICAATPWRFSKHAVAADR